MKMIARFPSEIVIFAAGLVLAAALWGYQARGASALSGADDVFSFDMWCLEMRLYPSQRCDARQPQDTKAYEQYRATAERLAEERATRAKRDQQLNQKLNPDPGNQKGK